MTNGVQFSPKLDRLIPEIYSEYKMVKRYLNKFKDAYERDIPFELTFNQFKKILSRKVCPFSGRVMTDDENQPDSRSLDRIDASKGYIRGNVIACSYRINCIKSNLTEEEILNIVKVIQKRRKLKFNGSSKTIQNKDLTL